ncbi:ribosomal protection-like ABC-F family protein, partial [Candidatus Allofournierella excrementavium]|uniref:ribosomal protection-like ABC-F family protein n=1 Tax=Candidatus Allofournierella excrementavium TaxID=2838591 RepID=UPI003A8C6423
MEDLVERKSAKQELQKAKRKFRQGSAPGAADRWPGRLAAGRTRAGPPSAKMLAKSRRLCYARNEKRRKGKVRQECAFAENFTQTCFYAVGFSPFVCAGIGRMLPGFSIFGNSLELCGNVCFRAFLRPDAPIRHLLQGQGGALMSKILLSANHIVHSFGERKILEFEKLTVHEGDRIGIVGSNGAGKTTLLNILAGELAPDEGSVARKAPVSYFRQFRQRAERADPQKCSEFGLSGKLCRERLSGGEMTRLGLAAMGKNAVLTFADEPTANLDADGVGLCCRMLEQCPTLLLVSHDRAVLDRLCTSIIEIKDGQLHFYAGGFTAFQKQREQAAGRQEFEYRQYQAEKARLEKAARRQSQAGKSVRKAPRRMGNSEARLHKREAAERAEKLESARKTILTRLEQLEAKEKPRETAPVRIDFSLTDPPANRQVAVGEHITFGYGKDLIFEDAAFSLPRGSKTALVGPNGAGKTTLMELIWSGAPGIRLVPKAKVGFFRQGLETLDLNKTVLENVMETSVQSENTMRGILARLLIRREDVFKKAGDLSGGERVKLAFAKLFGSPANLLLLDEPTNFLDMPAVEALQKMLEDYEGTVLFVSHDRAFSDGCATRTLRIAD